MGMCSEEVSVDFIRELLRKQFTQSQQIFRQTSSRLQIRKHRMLGTMVMFPGHTVGWAHKISQGHLKATLDVFRRVTAVNFLWPAMD